MSALLRLLVLLLFIFVLFPAQAHCFGAGSIPSFAYLHDRAFRHGDIENILSTVAKTTHRHAGGSGSLNDLFSSLASQGLGAILQGHAAAKFSKSDVKKIYFGNWLRDYSQAIDVAGLSKMTAPTLVMIVQVLGFMTFGFATREFHITPERLGVYLPIEHIDNPKGYAEKEGDARHLHPRLRPPVDPEELEIDKSNGMKKYMATEGGAWDTSTAHIRRTLRACIKVGRRADGIEGEDMWESFRLLGTALHTLEDFLAHSNWCEVMLRKLGHADVFCHVGDGVLVQTPDGSAPPLVTGTFGSADFVHSLLGEASDHLSQASVFDLAQRMDEARSSDSLLSLKSLFSQLPSLLNPSEKVGSTDSIEARVDQYHFDPNNYASEDIQCLLWDVLVWRDDTVRGIAASIESIPGLSILLDQIIDIINQCVYTLLAPVLIPIIQQTTVALQEQSQAVIDRDDQYEVFDNADASDPSHSILSKDHVDLILNEPAGRVAEVVVEHTVKLVVRAWNEEDEADEIIDKVLEAFHHPYYATGASQIQNDMLNTLQEWLEDMCESEREHTIAALTREGVRAGKNRRLGDLRYHSESEDTVSSLEGSGEYTSAREDEDSASEGEIESEQLKARQREHANRVLGGYKATLKNPRASAAAKRKAGAILAASKASSVGPSTTRAECDSEEGYLSDEGFSSQSSEYGDANSGSEWDSSGDELKERGHIIRRHGGEVSDDENYVPPSSDDEILD